MSNGESQNRVGKDIAGKEKTLSQKQFNDMLLNAVMKGDLLSVQTALAGGADVHTEFEMPLRDAALYEYPEIFRYLRQHGADFEKAFARAAGSGDILGVSKLIDCASTAAEKHVVKTLRAVFTKEHGPTDAVKVAHSSQSASEPVASAPVDSGLPTQQPEWVRKVEKVRNAQNRYVNW